MVRQVFPLSTITVDTYFLWFSQVLRARILLLVESIPHNMRVGRHPMLLFQGQHLEVFACLMHHLVHCLIIRDKLTHLP
jgi:hypothetical protein